MKLIKNSGNDYVGRSRNHAPSFILYRSYDFSQQFSHQSQVIGEGKIEGRMERKTEKKSKIVAAKRILSTF